MTIWRPMRLFFFRSDEKGVAPGSQKRMAYPAPQPPHTRRENRRGLAELNGETASTILWRYPE